MIDMEKSSLSLAQPKRDPEGFTEAARLRALSLCAIGADVETLSPGVAAAWFHGHCFLIRDNGEVVEL